MAEDAPQVTDRDPIEGYPTSVAGPPQKPTAPNPYEMLQKREAQTEATAAEVKMWRDKQIALAEKPLPRTPPPNVKDVGQPPQQHYQNVFKEAMNPLIFLTAMGAGMMSKNHGMGAMKAATGFMEGFQEGDQKRIDLEQKNWENNIKALTINNANAISRYHAILNNNSLTQVERQARIAAYGAQIGDALALDTQRSGNQREFFHLLEARERGVGQLMRQMGPLGMLSDDAKAVLDRAGYNQNTIDTMAIKYMETGQEPNTAGARGYGPTIKAAVVNRAHEMWTERGNDIKDLPKHWQDFRAEGTEKSSAARVRGLRGENLDMLLRATEAAIPAALEESAKVNRAGFVPLDKLIQGGKVITNDKNMVKFAAANLQLAEHWARAMNPTGIMRESDRDLALKYLDTARSHDTYTALVRQIEKQIRREREAVHVGGSIVPKGRLDEPDAPGLSPKELVLPDVGSTIDLGDGISIRRTK